MPRAIPLTVSGSIPASTSVRSPSSARAHQTPPPATTTGRSASRISRAARSIWSGSGGGPGSGVRCSVASGRSAAPKKTSSGTSMKTGPVRRLSAVRMHSAALMYASSAEPSVIDFLVRLRTNSTWSISCREPMPHRATGARPPMTNIGLSLPCAWASAEAEFVTPGPAVTAATPHSRVTFAQPSAANAADCSWRVSMIRMPCSSAPISTGQMCPPLRVKRWLTPARFNASATSSPALPESTFTPPPPMASRAY